MARCLPRRGALKRIRRAAGTVTDRLRRGPRRLPVREWCYIAAITIDQRGQTMFDDSEIGRLRTRLRHYLGRYLRRREDAEDVVQESFTRVLEAAAKGEIHYPPSYLYRTARNLAFNLRARKFNQAERTLEDSASPDVMDETEPGPEDRVMAQRQFELFCRVAASLPPQCRQVLVLRKVHGLSQREVAARLGLAISTVEKHLAKALRRCAQDMAAMQADQGDRWVRPPSRLKGPQ